jgi:hypothetical protein
VTGDPKPFRRAIAAIAAPVLAIAALVAVPATGAAAADTGINVPCGDNDALIRAFQSANNAWVNSWVVVNLAPGCTYTLTQPWLGAYADRGQIDPYQGTAHALPTLHIGTAYSRLILNGNGATIARAEGAPRFRFLSLDEFAVAQLNDVTFANGAAPHGSDTSTTNNEYCSVFISGSCHAAVAEGQGGGAIYNRGTLTLDGVRFTGNIAGNGENGERHGDTTGGSGGSGGAIQNLGTLTIDGGTFSGNSAGVGGTGGDDDLEAGGDGGNGGGGGAIANYGQLTVTGATFTGNHAGGPGGPGVGWTGEWGYSGAWGSGGAIVGRNLTIGRSLFQGNVGGEGTGGEGGAIAVDGGPATVENSTFDANSSGSGGAVAVYSGSLAVRSATFTGNHDATDQRGADVGFADAGSSLSFTNSVMLGNGTGADCAIGGRGAASTISGSTVYSDEIPLGTDVAGSDCHASAEGDFELGELQDNGGPTLSRMPAGELLGASEECLASDQRGQSRPATGCDVGAVERQELVSAGTVSGSTHVPAGTATSYSSVGAAGVGLEYQWSVVGLAATIDDPSAASPRITFTEAGDALVQLAVRISGVAEAGEHWTYAPTLAVRVGHTPNHLPEIVFDAPVAEAAKRQGDTGHYPFTVSDPDGDAFTLDGPPSCDAGATRTGWAYDPATASGYVDCRFDTAPAHNVVSVSFTDEWDGARTGYFEVTTLDVEPVITLSGPSSVDPGTAGTFNFSIAYSGPHAFTPTPSCFGGEDSPGIALVPGSLHVTTSGFLTTGSFQCGTALGDDRGQAWINAGTVGFTSRTFTVNSAALQLSASGDLGSMSEDGSVATVTYALEAHNPNGIPMRLVTTDVCVGGVLSSSLPYTVPEGTTTIVCRFGPQRGDYGLKLSVYDQYIGSPTVVTVPFTIIDVPPAITIVSDAGPEVDEFSAVTFHWTAVEPGYQDVTLLDEWNGCTQQQGNTRRVGAVTTGEFSCVFPNGPTVQNFTLRFTDGTSYVDKTVTALVREVAPVLATSITPRDLRFDQGVVTVEFGWAADMVNEEHLSDVTINWGDGTSTPWDGGIESPHTHAYARAGDFTITVDLTSDGVRLLGVPLDASKATSATIHVTAPALAVSAPASAPEGQTTTVTVPVPVAWTDAYTVDAASCGTDEHGAALPVANLQRGSTSYTFDCVWRYRDGESQQVTTAARWTDGGPASAGTASVAVANVAPTLDWVAPPDEVRAGDTVYTFAFTADDPSGVDWLGAALLPTEADPDAPAVSCGATGVVVALTSFDRATGEGSLGCRFPAGGATERLVVTLVDASGARSSYSHDVLVRGTATTLEVTLTPAATTVDEGGTIGFDVTVQGDGALSLFDLVTDCGAGNVLVSGPARLTGDADDRATGAIVCRFTDGPATPTVRVTAITDELSETDAVSVSVLDVAPRFADFDGVQHVSGGSAVVPLGAFADPGVETVTLVRLSTSWGYFVNYWGGAGVPATVSLTGVPGGESTVTLTVTNDDGTFVQTRTLTTSSLHLTVPADQTAEATSAAGAVVVYPAATAIDTRTGDPLGAPSCDHPSGDAFPLGVTTVTCTASDDEGATSTKSFTVTVRDDQAPVITITVDPPAVEAGVGGTGVIRYTATASDAVDGEVPVSCDVPDGASRGIGDTVISCTASDALGHLGTATATASVVDTTGPAVIVPADLTAEAVDGDGAWVQRPGYRPPWIGASSPTATATDLVDGPVSASCDGFDDAAQSAHFAVGTTTVTCTATDSRGNVGQASFEVTVVDTTSPQLTVSDQSAEATGPSGAAVEFTGLSAVDTVDDAPAIDCLPASGSVFPVGSTTASCTATDAHGNVSAPAAVVVTVTDTTAPVIPVPADLRFAAVGVAGADTTIAIPASDLVDGALSANCLPDAPPMALGSVAVTCTATDAHGNVATLPLTVEVVDGLPTITVPADIAVAASGASGATVSFAATGQDAVDGALPANCTPASGSVFPIGTTTVTCSVTDSSAHTVSGAFTVTVSDTDAPVIDVPADITVEATGPSGAVVTFAATASDTVSGALAADCDRASGSAFGLGSTTVTCGAVDAEGNEASASFVVRVVDTTAPTLTVPGALRLTTTDAAGITVTFAVTSDDLVDGAGAPSCSAASGELFPVGTTTVTCARVDAAGNRVDAAFLVTVELAVPAVPVPKPVTPASGGSSSGGSGGAPAGTPAPGAPTPAAIPPASGEARPDDPQPTPQAIPDAGETPASPVATANWGWAAGGGAAVLLLALLTLVLVRRRRA